MLKTCPKENKEYLLAGLIQLLRKYADIPWLGIEENDFERLREPLYAKTLYKKMFNGFYTRLYVDKRARWEKSKTL